VTAGDLLRFSLQALSGHRLRTMLSLIGMAIGVAAVVTLTALGEGARRYVTDQFASIGSNLLIVVPGKTETTGLPGVTLAAANDLTLDDSRAIGRGIPEAEKVAPMVIGTEFVEHGSRRRSIAIVGSNHEFLGVRRIALSKGENLPAEELERGRPVVILGIKAARELFPGEEPLGRIVRVGDWRMRVIGVLEPKGVQLGADIDETALVPVATAMKLFDRRSLFRVMIQVREGADLETAKGKVVRLLTERHDGEEDVTVLTQDAVVSTFSQILGALTLALGAIAAISLTVAGIGIMNVMLVSVSERTREVGLLRALGVKRGQILAVFLTESALLSAAGGLLGLAAGWAAVGLLVEIFPALPASPPPWAVAAALGLSLGVGILFGLLPARRAARLDPVAALAGR
jgi:putative ABC transport system permease protein